MKGNVRKSFVLVVVVASVMLALIGAAGAQQSDTKAGPYDKGWSALDNVDGFRDTLKKAGFELQEDGWIEFFDTIKECCLGHIPDTLANNPWPNTYVVLRMPTHEGVADPPQAPPGLFWQLRQDEAIVIVGQTPPPAAYFSYQTFANFIPPYPEGTIPPRIGAAVGDAINIGTINTIGPDRANQPIVYIITGHRETEWRVRQAALKAGYPAAIINVETISPVIAPLGIGAEGSWFYMAHRVAVPADGDELQTYVQEASERYEVFRVTPEKELVPDPEPVPVLRVRGTGHTEMELYPALKRLRQAILEQYAGKPHKELGTKVWELVTRDGRELLLEQPYVALQRGYQIIGGTRDANYLATYPNFMLREDKDEFVIVYGVNHQKTGKATYSSVSIYADKDRWFGVNNGTMLSPDFGDSARRYLPDDPDPNVDMLYAIKVARHCDEGEKYCMQVNQPDFLDINGKTYTCLLDDLETPDIVESEQLDFNKEEMFFLFRSYMEPETNVSPDDNELLYDQAIYFGPYEFPEP